MVTIGGERMTQGLTYTVEYNLDSTDGAYTGRLSLSSLGEAPVIERYELESCESVTATMRETNRDVDLRFDTTETTTTSVTLHVQLSTGQEFHTRPSILTALPLALVSDILQGAATQETIDEICRTYGKEGLPEKRALFSFQRDFRGLLSFDEYLTVMATFAELSDGYRRELISTSPAFFKNMLFHEKEYPISTRAEFDRRLSLFEVNDYLPTVDRAEVERLYISEWTKRHHPPTKPETFGFEIGNVLIDLETSAALEYLAERVTAEETDLVRERLKKDQYEYDEETYEDLKERALSGPPILRARHWKSLLGDAAFTGRREFDYILGNFLYWEALTNYDLEPGVATRMYQAAAKLFAYLNLGLLRQKANARQHIAASHHFRLNGSYNNALVESRRAMAIALNESGNWDSTLPNIYASARRDFALLQRNQLLNDGNYEGGIKTVRRAMDDITDMKGINESLREKLLNHLSANEHEMLALNAEADGDLLIAKTHLEEAFHYFDIVDQPPRKALINYKLEQLIERITTEKVGATFVNQERRQTQSSSPARDAEFRRSVLGAYDGRCAACGARRETADGRVEAHAAHIRAVGDDGPDLVQNGVCLCRLHHWAFDNGWLSIADDYTLLVADQPDIEGYDEFAPLAGRDLALPNEEYQAPMRDFLTHHRQQNGFEAVSDESVDDFRRERMTEDELAESNSVDVFSEPKQNLSGDELRKARELFSSGDERRS